MKGISTRAIRGLIMDKCRITDEVVSNDPQDAPDAVFNEYTVLLTIYGEYHTSIQAESAEQAMKQARAEWDRSNLTFIYTDYGVEENE